LSEWVEPDKCKRIAGPRITNETHMSSLHFTSYIYKPWGVLSTSVTTRDNSNKLEMTLAHRFIPHNWCANCKHLKGAGSLSWTICLEFLLLFVNQQQCLLINKHPLNTRRTCKKPSPNSKL
jgi:hypothetical protein